MLYSPKGGFFCWINVVDYKWNGKTSIEKIMTELQTRIQNLIYELIPKVREQVPESGLFNAVYADFENTDEELCLTHVMLKVEPVPKCIEGYINRRYLTCVGYKLPVPYKSTSIIKGGTKEEILECLLNDPSLITKIHEKVYQLSDNLLDV